MPTRTRAQMTRDAALRRLTRVNHSLAAAALVSVGVLTDVVAHTASGHTVTSSTKITRSSTGRVELLTDPQIHHSRRAAGASRGRAVAHHAHTSRTSSSSSAQPSSSAPSTVTPSQSSSSGVSSSNTAPVSSVQPTVVAVSGGS